jgi:penicillin-binding protein-related factor A (putative recombinase)
LSKTQFEEDIKKSETKNILVHRQRDVYIPPECRKCNKIHVPKNPVDFIIFKTPILILTELKSSGQKSISLDEKIIKKHQSASLLKFVNYEKICSAFIFNFRNYDNQTYLVHIDDFIKFVKEGSRKSIPLSYCEEVGIKLENKIMQVNYKYNLNKLFDDINSKYFIEIEQSVN